MPEPLRVLILEDRPEDAELMLYELRQAGFDPAWQRVECEVDFLVQLDQSPEVILADYTMPRFDALLALALLQTRGLDIPFIVVTGTIGEDVAVECIKRGAGDYLLKDRLARLGSSVIHALEDRQAREDKRQADAALRESEVRYRTLVDAMDDAINVKDLRGRYVTINSEFLRRTRLSREDVVGKTAAGIYGPEDAREIEEGDLQVFSGGEPCDVDMWGPWNEGSKVYHHRRLPLRNGEGEMVGLVTVSKDVTESRNAEQKVRENEARFRRMAETPKSFVFRIEMQPSIMCSYISPTVQEILGYSAEEFHSDANLFRRIVIPEQLGALEGLADGRTGERTVSFAATHKSGQTVWLEQRNIGIQDGWGAVVAFEGLVRDITEQKVNEEELSRRLGQLRRTMERTIQAMATSAEQRDPYTAGHQRNVAKLAAAIATRMGLPEDEVEGIRLSGLVHDLGKISIPSEILCKPASLTELEFSLIKDHPEAGSNVLRGIEFSWPIADFVLQHHERMDGSGYPQGLQGESILLGSRIIAVADVVEAMSADRPYRPAVGLENAMTEIAMGRGKLYDHLVVDACLYILHEEGLPG